MVELEYNGERYMVDGGKWYRRLKMGEVVNFVNQMRSSLDGKWLQCSALISGIVSSCEVNNYRVPCTDPRPPFVVGQWVKVARKDESWGWWDKSDEGFVGMCGSVVRVDKDGDFRIRFYSGFKHTFPPWCLDPVEPVTEQDEPEGHKHVPFEKVGTINVKFKEAVPLRPCGSDDDEAVIDQKPTGEPCLSWILDKLAKQPEKKERTLAVLQRAMSELVGLEAE